MRRGAVGWPLAGLAVAIAMLGAWIAYATLRPRVETAALLASEQWVVPAASNHDAFTDLVRFADRFVLAHVAAPYHMGSARSSVRVRRSADARSWEELAVLRLPGRDIRDPKLAVIGDRLLLYVLANDDFLAIPHQTFVAASRDGRTWSAFEPTGPAGFLLWRPKTPDGVSWYVAAFAVDGSSVRLLRSLDGRSWAEVSVLHEGAGASETEIGFLPDGTLLALVRLEAGEGLVQGSDRNATLVTSAEPPYRSWRTERIEGERLDGPLLFSIGDAMFAVARRQPGARGGATRLGGLLSRKRTAIYRVEPSALTPLADLPSSGDTSYAGVVVGEEDILLSYYSSDAALDPPWLLGHVLPTRVRIARIPRSVLLALRDRPLVD